MIDNICILGGGTAGFLTAAVLSKLGIKVKCIYSSQIGIIGVGESTQLPINEIFTYLDLKDQDWMKKCNATYKTTIAFESWSNPGEQFFYPFQTNQQSKEEISAFFELCGLFPEEVHYTQFARYASPSSRFGELNKLYKDGWDFDSTTAYHFDSHLLSKLLYEIGTNNGVEFIDDKYLSAVQNEDGIEYLVCEKTGKHYADLFVDCSGFKSLLLGQEMRVPFKSYETQINNRALRCKVPYTDKDNQLKSYTNNVAMDNGWCWEIPLWDGMSLGYVHTLKFASEEEIEQEFREFVEEKYGVTPETSLIEFKSGRYEKGWVKNVASVGLAYGFIEPLESTGLSTVVTNVFRLLEVVTKSKSVNSFGRELFNYPVSLEIDKQKGFVDMHYTSAHKCDTPYWKYVTNQIEHNWDDLNHKISLDMTTIDRDYASPICGGLAYILAGNGYIPYSPGYLQGTRNKFNKEELEKRKNDWLTYDHFISASFSSFPSTHQFLMSEIYH